MNASKPNHLHPYVVTQLTNTIKIVFLLILCATTHLNVCSFTRSECMNMSHCSIPAYYTHIYTYIFFAVPVSSVTTQHIFFLCIVRGCCYNRHTITHTICNLALQYFKVLDGRYRLIGWIYLTLCQLPQRATFCILQHSIYLHFARVPLRFPHCEHLPTPLALIPLYHFVDAKLHIFFHISILHNYLIINVLRFFINECKGSCE